MAWDNTLPADNTTWDQAAGMIRDNWDALEAIFGVDLATNPALFAAITCSGAFKTVDPWHDVRAYGAVVDGVTDDAAAIQAAMDAAGASGGTVFFPPGTYAVGSAGWTGLTLATKSKVTLRGDPRGAVIKVLYEPTQYVTGASEFKKLFRLNGWTDALVTGLTVDLNSQTATGAFGLDSCTRTTIRDCYVYNGGDTSANGITSVTGTNNKYIDNHITGGGNGIYLGTTNSGQAESNALVQGNHCIDNGADAIHGTMVNCSIVNNYCEGATSTGIELSSLTDVSKDTTVSGNVCSGCAYGIAAANVGTRGISIVGNVCKENSVSGIFVYFGEEFVINGNTCIDNNFDNVGSGYGIGVNCSNRITVTGNQCYDTRLTTARTQIVGIYVYADNGNTADVVVDGNMAYSNEYDGIRVANTGGYTVDRVVVSNNISRDNGRYGIGITDAGSGDIDSIMVSGNICEGNTTTDIDIDTTITGTFKDNFAGAGSTNGHFCTLADSATPDVEGATFCETGGTTSILNILGGIVGQQITILAKHTIAIGNIQNADDGRINLWGSVNWTMYADDTLTLVLGSDLEWYEVTRSNN